MSKLMYKSGRPIQLALMLAALGLVAGCQCIPTKCAEGTMVDPDGGGEIVDRDDPDGNPRPNMILGGRCIAET